MQPKVLVEAAVQRGLVDRETARAAAAEAARLRRPLLEHIALRLRLPARAFAHALAELRGLAFVDAEALRPDPELLQRLPRILVQRKGILPLRESGEGVVLATADPDDITTLDSARRALGRAVVAAVAEPRALDLAIRRALSDTAAAQPIDGVGLLDQVMSEGYASAASDIHLEPDADGYRIRIRIDGRLRDFSAAISTGLGQATISRIKVLSGLDIAEKREPQDGGFRYPLRVLADITLDVRVATAPTRFGERATLRLLGVAEVRELDAIGLPAEDLARVETFLERPRGLCLLAGPTGCGKTTTLYAALRRLVSTHRNVLTVEDPIESIVVGTSQLQVDAAGKLTFAKALRSLLRHDPDVLMVGEIRDAETAEIALKAALTGHAVLSSLHTSSTVGAVTRLRDLGMQSYLVAATLEVVIAQRLVRRLCERCREAVPVDALLAGTLELDADDEARVFRARGCACCLGTGYRGRMGIFELLLSDRPFQEAVARGVAEPGLLDIAQKNGLRTLRERAIEAVLAGGTSAEEAYTAAVL